MRSRRRILWWLVALSLVLAVALAAPFGRRVRAYEFLSRLATPGDAGGPRLIETELTLAGRSGPIRARLYHREDLARGPGLVVAHGVHYRGIDERRLVPFARELARAGRIVLTPELSELADYRLTRKGVSVIEDATLYLGDRRDLVDEQRVGVMGFSFAGGLALVAASGERLRGRVEYVTSVGGHHDLRRVLGFLLRDRIETPAGVRHRAAHEYGLVVLVYGYLDHFVPAVDEEAVAEAFRHWLHEDRPLSHEAAARITTADGKALFERLTQSRLRELAPEIERVLLSHAGEFAELSPRGKLARVGVPVYLLHGSRDSVIPASESEWAALELDGAPHRVLVSPLLEHVELGRDVSLQDGFALLEFMAEIL
jgi:dienelactone hydrolase